MKTLRLASWLMLVLALALPVTAQVPEVVVTPSPEVAAPSPADEVGSCGLAPAEAPLFQASCGLCPVWAPSCTKDSQCDAFCGGVGYGACLPFQACTRCCGCNT